MWEEVTYGFLEHWHLVAYSVFILYLVYKHVSEGIKKNKGGEAEASQAEKPHVVTLCLLAFIALRSEQLNKQTNKTLLEIQTIQKANDIDRVKKLRGQLDPILEMVFGDHVSSELNGVIQAIESGKITLHSTDEFRLLYKETLRKFPKAEFCATSVPSKAYFWGDVAMEEAITKFIKDGGKMKRIFFLKSADDINSQEVKTIILKQLQMGVEVYITNGARIPAELNNLFLVDSQERLAWQVDIDSSHRISRVSATVKPNEIQSYVQNFDNLLNLGYTRRIFAKEDIQTYQD